MYKLIRENDGLCKRSDKILWIEFNKDGRFKEKYEDPAIGRSLLMSPFNDFFTWQTTQITEIIENTKDSIKFRTKNSIYILNYKK